MFSFLRAFYQKHTLKTYAELRTHTVNRIQTEWRHVCPQKIFSSFFYSFFPFLLIITDFKFYYTKLNSCQIVHFCNTLKFPVWFQVCLFMDMHVYICVRLYAQWNNLIQQVVPSTTTIFGCCRSLFCFVKIWEFQESYYFNEPVFIEALLTFSINEVKTRVG